MALVDTCGFEWPALKGEAPHRCGLMPGHSGPHVCRHSDRNEHPRFHGYDSVCAYCGVKSYDVEPGGVRLKPKEEGRPMTRKRVSFEVPGDADEVALELMAGYHHADKATFQVERLPDPDIVEEFTIKLRITSPAHYAPAVGGELNLAERARAAVQAFLSNERKVEVVE